MEGLETAFDLVLPHRIGGRGEAPSIKILSSPLKEHILKESQREAKPLLYKSPLPLIKGKGIKGMGLPNKI